MRNLFSLFSKNQSLVYKVFLFVAATFLVIYLLPKGGQFKYNFQKGKPWQYENLYAPFSFTIKKDAETIDKEKEAILLNAIPYFEYNSSVVDASESQFLLLLDETYVDSLTVVPKAKIKRIGLTVMNEI